MAEEEPLCAVSVLVLTPKGEPIVNAVVDLLAASGSLEKRERTATNGVARICDFGFGTHDLVISRGPYFPVRVPIRRILERHPINLTVVLNPAPQYPTERNYCVVNFRITNLDKTPIENATVSSRVPTFPQQSDRFGRIWLYVPTDMSLDLAIAAEGYKQKREEINCRSTELIERAVVLEAEH